MEIFRDQFRRDHFPEMMNNYLYEIIGLICDRGSTYRSDEASELFHAVATQMIISLDAQPRLSDVRLNGLATLMENEVQKARLSGNELETAKKLLAALNKEQARRAAGKASRPQAEAAVDIWKCEIKNEELARAREAFREAALPRVADMHLDRIFIYMSPRTSPAADRKIAIRLWNEVFKKLTEYYRANPGEDHYRPLLCNTIGYAINTKLVEGESQEQAKGLLKLLEKPVEEASKPKPAPVSPAKKAGPTRMVSYGLMPDDRKTVDEVMHLYRSLANDSARFMEINHKRCFERLLKLCDSPFRVRDHFINEGDRPVNPEGISALKEMTAIIIAFAAENLMSRAHLRQVIVEAGRQLGYAVSSEVRPILNEARKAIESMGRSPGIAVEAGSPKEDIWTREIQNQDLRSIRYAYEQLGPNFIPSVYNLRKISEALSNLMQLLPKLKEDPGQHTVAVELWNAILEKIKARIAENPAAKQLFDNFFYLRIEGAINDNLLEGEQLQKAKAFLAMFDSQLPD